jgi:hypothetical protein
MNFSNPEIAASNNSPDRKALLIWLDESTLLDVMPTADLLARLRINKHGILAVDFMLDIEIVSVRSIPVTLQRKPHGLIIHVNPPAYAFGYHCAIVADDRAKKFPLR